MARDTYLESYADGTMASRRPQFAGVKTFVEERGRTTYGVLTAPCGCRHSTRINLDARGRGMASCDGVTTLCAEHAGVDDEE